MPSYILRDLPPDLWDKFRKRAELQRWPLRALILHLLELYADGKIQLAGEPPPRPGPPTIGEPPPNTGT